MLSKSSGSPIGQDMAISTDADNLDGSESEIDEKYESKSKWTPGVFKRLPLLVGVSVVLILACIVGCIVVVEVSRDHAVTGWSIQPAVWLAILTAIANTCLRYIFFEGVSVAWWNYASSSEGRTVSELHRFWSCSTGFWASLRALAPRPTRTIGIALASTLVALVSVDGPLIQRSSSIRLIHPPAELATVTTLNITLATQLPFGYSAGVAVFSDSESASMLETPLAPHSFLANDPWYISAEVASGLPISIGSTTGCSGVCDAEVLAAGFDKQCSISSRMVDVPLIDNASMESETDSWDVFGVNLSYVYPSLPILYPSPHLPVQEAFEDESPKYTPYLELVMNWTVPFTGIVNSTTVSVRRRIFTRHCKLYPGTSLYKIRVQNRTLDDTLSRGGDRITLRGEPEFQRGTVENAHRAVYETGLRLTAPLEAASSNLSKSNLAEWVLSLPYPPALYPVTQGNSLCPQASVINPRAARDGPCGFFYSTAGAFPLMVQEKLQYRLNVRAPSRDEGKEMGYVYLSYGSSYYTQFERVNRPFVGGGNQSRPTKDEVGRRRDWYFVSWDDPAPVIFGILDELMFRASISMADVDALAKVSYFYAGPDDTGGAGRQYRNATAQDGRDGAAPKLTKFPAPQLVRAVDNSEIAVFESNSACMWASVGLILATLMSVLVLFHGYWRLGRQTSLSPIETAKAFDGPLLREAESNASVEQIVGSRVGQQVVRYGQVLGRVRPRVGFGEVGDVGTPAVGGMYR